MLELINSPHESHPANIICSLSSQFFYKDWCVGTGGAMSIRDRTSRYIYITPSGVQKELMKPSDLYVLDKDGIVVLYQPVGLKISDCSLLFLECYNISSEINAVVHTHSQNSVLISMLYKGSEFTISHMEQIKALPSGQVDLQTGKMINLSYLDTLCIPIIENKPHEHDLLDDLKDSFRKYPNACAVLVRRHGLFVWGPSIEKAKIYHESIDYLFSLAIKMHQLNID